MGHLRGFDPVQVLAEAQLQKRRFDPMQFPSNPPRDL